MKKYTTPLLLPLFLLLNSFTEGIHSYKTAVDTTTFLSIVQQANMIFTPPPNTIETPVITNDELNYHYAIKDTLNNIEIRYLVYPLQELVKKYNGPHKDSGAPVIDPNMIHTNLMLIYSQKIQDKELNIQQSMPEVNELTHGMVNQEFNADWGAEVTVQPCDEFGQKYKYCTIFAIHKDNTADAFIMYLYNNKDTFEQLVKPDYHSLVYKKN